MDSKSIYKKSFSGKPGAKQPRWPKRRVYCILEKEGYIYFPIAAKYSPYSLHDGIEENSFLAGMPNFFGGKMERNESIEETLVREIKEESQEKIDLEIPEGALEAPVFKDPAGTAQPEQNTYKFYVLKLEKCPVKKFDWRGEDFVSLDPFKKMEGKSKDYCAQYEDSFLVRVDKEHLCDFINSLEKAAEKVSEKVLEKASEKEVEEAAEEVRELLDELGIDYDATPESIVNWKMSHTSTAFTKIVK